MIKMKKFHYIAEINLPNTSAYALHVLKMCDAFAELKYDVKLIIFIKIVTLVLIQSRKNII